MWTSASSSRWKVITSLCVLRVSNVTVSFTQPLFILGLTVQFNIVCVRERSSYPGCFSFNGMCGFLRLECTTKVHRCFGLNLRQRLTCWASWWQINNHSPSVCFTFKQPPTLHLYLLTWADRVIVIMSTRICEAANIFANSNQQLASLNPPAPFFWFLSQWHFTSFAAGKPAVAFDRNGAAFKKPLVFPSSTSGVDQLTRQVARHETRYSYKNSVASCTRSAPPTHTLNGSTLLYQKPLCVHMCFSAYMTRVCNTLKIDFDSLFQNH